MPSLNISETSAVLTRIVERCLLFLPQALMAVLILIAGLLIARWLSRLLTHTFSHSVRVGETVRGPLVSIVRYVVIVFTLIIALGQLGVEMSSLLAILGAAGLAVGLALQGTLTNIAAGIMLLVLRPFRIGEDVQIGSVAGVIEEIGLFATSLRRGDGVYILAPNSTLWNQPVQNFTRNGVRRNDVAITLPESADIGKSQKALLDLALASAKVKKQPAPTSFVSEVVDSKVTLTLRYWSSTADFFSAKTELTKQATIRIGAEARSPEERQNQEPRKQDAA